MGQIPAIREHIVVAVSPRSPQERIRVLCLLLFHAKDGNRCLLPLSAMGRLGWWGNDSSRMPCCRSMSFEQGLLLLPERSLSMHQ